MPRAARIPTQGDVAEMVRLAPENLEGRPTTLPAYLQATRHMSANICHALGAILALADEAETKSPREQAVFYLALRALEDAERLDNLLGDELRDGHPYAVLLDREPRGRSAAGSRTRPRRRAKKKRAQ